METSLSDTRRDGRDGVEVAEGPSPALHGLVAGGVVTPVRRASVNAPALGLVGSPSVSM